MTTGTHGDRAHARLGPSSAARWGTCPGSEQVIKLHLEKYGARRGSGGRASDVGTIAHEVGEDMLRGNLPPSEPPELREGLKQIDEEEWAELLRHCMGYRDYVHSLVEPGDLLLLEKRVTMKRVSPHMFGTGDVIIFKKRIGKLIVVDLKYGYGYVEIQDNMQAKLYLIGALELLDEMGRLSEVKCFEGHIYQPRIDNIGGYPYSLQDIYEFTGEMQRAVARIEEGDETRVPSEAACKWCPGNGTELCPESATRSLAEAAALVDSLEDLPAVTGAHIDAKDPAEFPIEQLVRMRHYFPELRRWMERCEEHLIQNAARGKVPGMKVVEGRGSMECVLPDEVEFIVGPGAYHPPKLKSKTDLTKLVGAKNFDHLLGHCYVRKPGKPTLVLETDKREALPNPDALIDELEDLD